MNSILLKTSIFQIVFIIIMAFSISSCGSSVENPVNPSDKSNDQTKDKLVVDVKVSKKNVSPGDTVELSATVEPIESNQLIFKWVNLTGYGTLSNTDGTSTVWTAPNELAPGEVKVEVIHLVVVAITQIISVTDSKVNTNTEIYNATKTIPLTVNSTQQP